jgi:5-methylcytosine-specific restriction protein A
MTHDSSVLLKHDSHHESPIRSTLFRIGSEYKHAAQQNIAGHKLAHFIRNEGKEHVADCLDLESQGFTVDGSAGKGNWAGIPWIAVYDPVVTKSATRGYYVVYLFNIEGQTVYLSLNQGTTAIYDEFKNGYVKILRDRASLIGTRLSDFAELFPCLKIPFEGSSSYRRGYEAGHALGVKYDILNLPSEEVLQRDLSRMLRAYRALTYRGGTSLDFTEEEHTGLLSIEESRRYRMHRGIERNSTTSREVKKAKGYRCEACGMLFSDVYGQLGKDFIEAHHLYPLSELSEETVTKFDPQKDFAVLCSNCHRMIHRLEDCSNISDLKIRIQNIDARGKNE